MAVDFVDQAISTGARQVVVCDDLEIDVKTYKRWKKSKEDKRRGPHTRPANKLTDNEVIEIVQLATSREYVDLPPCKIVPLLADKGVYIASESSFYKILKEQKLLTHRGLSKPRVLERPRALTATGIHQIFTWDITYLQSDIRGQFYYLYAIMDIFSRKIVGQKVYERESMECAAELIKSVCIAEKIQPGQVILHSDNGSAMKGATMLATLQKLGIVVSFGRPRVSDDNPYSESLFKTLKYCPLYPLRPFKSLEEANAWASKLTNWYNTGHLHSGLKFIAPSDRHQNLDIEILRKRIEVYRLAKMKHPSRWSGAIRNWDRDEKVYLNCVGESKKGLKKCRKQRGAKKL